MVLQRLSENKADENYPERRCNEVATVAELKSQREHIFENAPLVSVVVPAYETDEEFLRALIDSVLLQSYEKFELVIADAGGSRCVPEVLAGYDDERIVYKKLAANDGIAENTNRGIEASKGEIITFLDHDDTVEPDALFHIVSAISQGAQLVYTDEDKYDGNVYFKANRKHDFDLDLLLSNNYICHMFAVKREILDEVGGFRKEFDGAQDYDLILRCVAFVLKDMMGSDLRQMRERIVHIPRVLYHWRDHSGSTAENPEAKLYAYEAGRRALEAYCTQRGVKAVVAHTEHRGFYRIQYADRVDNRNIKYFIPENTRALQADYQSLSQGIFTREEVKMVVFRCLDKSGKVQEKPYARMKYWDSGVMHTAHMRQNVDRPNGEVYCVNENSKGRLIVYAPDIMFKRM